LAPKKRHSIMLLLSGKIIAMAMLLTAVPVRAASVKPVERQIWNAAEVHRELTVDPSADAQVKEYFPSFLDYQDLMLFHPKIGYYSSGRVSFTIDYRTFPDMLAPYFGDMIAEQSFRMWDGMRQAGTLAAQDRFTLAEFGAGDGALAESILDYIGRQASENPDPRWREFERQAVYICYDRSPALSAVQAKRNARFGTRFEAREGDATDPAATIAQGSLKGVVLSNELPDAFSVHKVILSADGSAEVAFVVPSLSQGGWNKLEKFMPVPVRDLIKKDNQAIKGFMGNKERCTFLSRAAFIALLESMAGATDYAAKVHTIQFREVYVPVRVFPELAEHLRRYAHDYAIVLAKGEKGVVAYINLGEGKFVQGVARILKAGYVLTVDYGSNWDGIMPQEDFDHLRIYGPRSQRANSDPYRWPTLNDITTDVNFSHMAAEGRLAGLRTAYFGPQRALQSGTPVSLAALPPNRRLTDRQKKEFKGWVQDFQTSVVFKALVQQKDGTDPAYAYPEAFQEPVDVSEDQLTPDQRERAVQIEKQLSAPFRK
jgi:SAM-dependent MidA family methyltransferase